MTDRLERHQLKLNRRADRDPLRVRLVSARDVLFPPQCPACGAPATARTEVEKHCRYTSHSHDGAASEHAVARLAVSLCSSCARRHTEELRAAGRRSNRETSVSRAIEYEVNPETESLFASAGPAWHGFRFRTPEYAAAFRELNARLLWSPKRHLRDNKTERRFQILQLIILILFAAALASWAYLGR
jgi:hypothetical protein